MTLDDLKAAIAARFPEVEGLPTARCQTGEQYVVLGTPYGGPPGIVDEGAMQEGFSSEESACAMALQAFDSYAADKSGTLYWRMPPRLDTRDRNPWPMKHRNYLRLVISAAPILWPDLEAYHVDHPPAPKEPVYLGRGRLGRRNKELAHAP